jgi:hypothetical protein
MDASTNLNLPFLVAAQAQKHVTHNEALRTLDAVVQLMALDQDLATPPGSPTEGARYIVAASPSGAWAGQAGKIAAYQDGAWAFYAPREGWLAWVADEDKLYVWTGSAWAEFAGGGGGLANVVEDTTPQLGGDLDANGHDIGFDDGTGITDDAGNEHIVFHKTASAVNQVGVTNAAAGTAPQIAAEGGDTNVDLTLAGKGTGHPRAAMLGVNAAADATTRFAIAAAASLFNHAGAGHQHKINKAAAGDTASLLFQTGFSGRAEMGTAGDDDFHFKVSADGSAWNEAILIDRSTGRVALPATPYFDLPEGSAPATPASGKVRLYAKTDGSLYQKDDAGTETVLAGGGGGGGLANVVEDTTPELGGDLESNGNDIIVENGDAIVGGSTAGHAGRIKVRDVDGAAWVDVLTWTANNTPTADLGPLVTHGGAAIYKAGGSDVAVADGGTGASDAAGARANLGLVIGSDVQAFDELLAEIAALSTDPNADSGLFFDDSAGNIAYWTPANGLEFSGTSLQATANQRTATLTFVIDGGGSAIATGIKGDLEIPFACTINQVTLLADQSGSIVVDIWKDTYANYPPTGADSITASAKPTISSAAKSQDATLTGWTTSIAAGDVLRFNVDSATTIQRCTVSLKVTKS